LAANCLDQVDVPFFLNSFNSIKATAQNSSTIIFGFDNEGPSFVNEEIQNKFKDSMFGKTSAWVIAHCLAYFIK